MNHLTLDDIANILDGADDDDARAHLRTCAACAEMLEREAALDEEVDALAAQLRFCPGCTKPVADDAPRCTFCGVAFAPGGMRVESVLAESDHGRLYLAHGPDGPVALKEIVFARVPDVEALDRFEREARLLKQLRYDRIPRYVASFSEGEGVHLRLYLAQRYVDGPALLEELETKRFGEDEARAIARDVLSILVDLQALSPPVIHRDVKPANLVRDTDGKLALVDFGSARDVAKTTGGTLVGTFGYMPVEQLSGVVDESTDVYALAATLVHVLTRRPPWEALKTGALPSSLSLSSGFRRFLVRCLAPRDKRFANAREALIALDAAPRVRRPFFVAVAVAIGVGGAAAAPAALDALRKEPPPAVVVADDIPIGGDIPPERRAATQQLARQLRDADLGIDQYIGDVVACGRVSTYLGDVEAEWTVTSAGKVEDVSVRGNDGKIVQCMTQKIQAWEFPPHEGGPMVVERTFDFSTVSSAPAQDGQKVTIELAMADIRNVIRLLAQVGGRNIIFADDVQGKVTMTFKNVPWDIALAEVLTVHDLIAEESNGVIRIRKR